MKSLSNKINTRMDELQAMMEKNFHLEDPVAVEEHIESVTKFWSVLSEQDRDYIHGCRFAIESEMEWNVGDKE